MEYTKLGRTGLDVSRICLGCMSYGGGNALHQACGQVGRADPDAHELSHRVQHDHRQCATIAPQAAGWARNAIRSRWRPIELPRKSGPQCLSDQSPTPAIDGLLHAGRRTNSVRRATHNQLDRLPAQQRKGRGPTRSVQSGISQRSPRLVWTPSPRPLAASCRH